MSSGSGRSSTMERVREHDHAAVELRLSASSAREALSACACRGGGRPLVTEKSDAALAEPSYGLNGTLGEGLRLRNQRTVNVS